MLVSVDYERSEHDADSDPDNVGRVFTMPCGWGVKQRARPWYAKHAEAFIAALKGRNLAEVKASWLERYFEQQGRKASVADWQFDQMIHALRILFVETLKPRWAQAFPWDEWRQRARELGNAHPTLERESSSVRPLSGAIARTDNAPSNAAITRLAEAIRQRHYSIRTERMYRHWVERFLAAFGETPCSALSQTEVESFLQTLALRRKVSASTQSIALNALVFFFANVLERPLGDMTFARAKRSQKLPVVLSKSEIKDLFGALEGVYALMAGLMYGSGLRLMECVRLRVQDVDFDSQLIKVVNGKGGKHRVVPLPVRYTNALHEHLARAKSTHEEDLAAGFGEVYLPQVLARKLDQAAKRWCWQYVFPTTRLSTDPRSGKTHRHHLHETALQRAISKAGQRAGIAKVVSSHALRHKLPHIYSKPVAISVRCRNYSATPMCRRRWSIPMC